MPLSSSLNLTLLQTALQRLLTERELQGCAKRVGQLCKDAGLTLTTVGATYPYGIDPDDSNIRIAPSYPDVDELSKAVELLCICVKLAAVEKLIEE